MLLSYSISRDALKSPDLLLSYSVITLASHNTIILIITPKSSVFQPYPKPTQVLEMLGVSPLAKGTEGSLAVEVEVGAAGDDNLGLNLGSSGSKSESKSESVSMREQLSALAVSPRAVADAGRRVCPMAWEQLLVETRVKHGDQSIPHYRAQRACYGSALIYVMLTRVFGMEEHLKQFVPLESKEPFGEVGWALGAAVAQM